jgi:acyl carrier protein phosphodiesterase
MNYLAHLFLAGKEEGMILGALLEDYIVGGIENERNKNLPPSVKNGLWLHRHIDSFTDTDPTVGEIKQLFYPGFGKYASVIVDVLLDHYLHRHWEGFAEEDFTSFKDHVYTVLQSSYLDIQPTGLKKMVASMIEHDWLPNYIHLWGVERAFVSLNRRVKQVDLTSAMPVMEAHYEKIDTLFMEYFPRLKASCEHKRYELS